MITPLANELRWFVGAAKARRLRSMREFAEKEIIIPDGPFKDHSFRCDRQPYTGIWFDAVDSRRWNRHVALGPTQSGKTLCAFIIPLFYHLFEVQETVICGLPDMDLAEDKWRMDIKPALEQTRFRDLLPTSGSGSKGGMPDLIQFRNGAALKFMSGGGGDKSRSAFTSRVLVITETDGLDLAGEASREADKITQMEGRTRAYGSRKCIYMECTVSIEQGRTWREYQGGTTSRIALPCPHCQQLVTPEREHLQGHIEAETIIAAKEQSAFYCPGCGEAWNEAERRSANERGILVHRGQEITPEGAIVGTPAATDTLGFRWSAVNNLFVTAGDVGGDEWKGRHDPNEDNAEKELRQFVWALPYVPAILDLAPLTVESIQTRLGPKGMVRGLLPAEAKQFAIGIDIGKWLCHWFAACALPGFAMHAIDYARLEVPTKDLGEESAIMNTLRQFKDLVLQGFVWQGHDRPRVPDQVWIDSGYMTAVVYAFCREANAGRAQPLFRPTKGHGAGQQKAANYHAPAKRNEAVLWIGEGYHFTKSIAEQIIRVDLNADYWKSFTHARLTTPLEPGDWTPGTLTLFQSGPSSHFTLAKHFTAEKQVQEFIPGKGEIIRWERERQGNHYFDAAAICSGALHFCGARLLAPDLPPAASPPAAQPSLTTPDGRPFFVMER